MDKNQATELIQTTFPEAFDKARFRTFAINVLNRLDESKAQQWSTQYVKDAFKGHVHRYERLGTYTSPEKERVDVLVVYLTAESKLERARTAIRNFVADHLKARDEKDAALVAFVSPTETQWRFSYVKMEYATVEKESGKVGVETRLTPARRFSYMVGEGESCHTAQTRFLDLLQDTSTDPTLAQIEEAFSVEAVTKEFFGKYAELFGDINAALEKMVGKDKTLRDEFTAKGVNTVDFAKKLMGQVVFLYFLQKKGWLGVEKGKDWGTGPRDFLRRMANGAYGKYENFFNDILEPLFYDTLATDRGHEAWCSRFKCRIPFLNGGLFEPLADYNWKKTDILIPNKLFTNNEFVEEGITGTGVLDVFDRYNFTVNEAEPLEKEVAIDPEMLGKVFENLIEENRRKGLGSYYTPREIVHYMCQESLISYLDTAVNEEEGSVPRPDIETFIRLGEQISHYESVEAKYAIKMPKSIEKNAKALDNALKVITACDPAVGSGAFPVGMMTEIVRARAALTPYFNDVAERTPYHFKRHAIQNCLYGVDIDSSAVEIAKLRLWLSLVVDEEDVKQVKPLPNLDYKVVVGNSLLGVEKNLFNNEQFKRLEALKPKFFNESDRKQKSTLKDQIEAIIHELTNGRETFDFEIYFSEVYHAKGGFDVLIANPPYVDSEEMTRSSAELRTLLTHSFRSAKGNWDLFVVFIEQGLLKANASGIASYIVPNKLLGAPYAKHIRQVVTEHHMNFIRDYSAVPVFESVAVYPVVFQAAKMRSRRSVTMQRMKSLEVADITHQIDSETFHRSTSWDQFLQDQGHASLIERFQKWPPLHEHCDSVASAATVAEAYLLAEHMIEDPKPDLSRVKKFINTGTIDPFQSLWGKQNTRYIKQGYLHPVVRDSSIRAMNDRRLRQAAAEKLIIGGMTLSLECFYDKGEYLAGKSTTIVLPKAGVPLLYLGAILNSKCASYWYRTFFKSMSLAGGYLRIGHAQLRMIPIPPYGRDTGEPIVSLAKRLLKTPESGELWKQLNDLVCRLYALTAEEIRIVEAGP
jgi:type I restriction-modification system DNA methylase subunit